MGPSLGRRERVRIWDGSYGGRVGVGRGGGGAAVSHDAPLGGGGGPGRMARGGGRGGRDGAAALLLLHLRKASPSPPLLAYAPTVLLPAHYSQVERKISPLI